MEVKYLIGIDIGTSSAKCITINPDGGTSALSSREYKIDTPCPGWAEQNPEVWWRATVECLRECLARSGADGKEIAGISFSGQMHGSAFIDKKGRPLRSAIIWADQRSAPQCERIKNIVGTDGLRELTGNSPSPGFMASSVVWVKENEPEVFRQTAKVLLPKDYVRYRLTGEISSEVSDASSTLLFDVKNRSWSWKLMKLLDLPESILPEIHESQEVSGLLSKEAAAELGLAQGIPVVAGGGDQAMAAIGNGVVKPGKALLTIGTGGQLFAVMDDPAFDPGFRVHTFCHAIPQKWHLLGAMLSAGLSLKWFRDQILRPLASLSYTELSKMAESAPPGSEGLIFLPYLIGERTPHLDPKAAGVFFGLTLRHGLGHLIRAIMEGVAFGMREGLEIFRELGMRVDRLIASGGGATSALWRQILADALGMELATTNINEQAAYGAALTAGVGVGIYRSLDEAVERTIRIASKTEPNAKNTKVYNERYMAYQSLYPALKDNF